MENEKFIKAWITRYALIDGIYQIDAIQLTDRMICNALNKNKFYHKPNWYLILEEAQKRANDMKTRKIVKLKKEIDKLEKMKF